MYAECFTDSGLVQHRVGRTFDRTGELVALAGAERAYAVTPDSPRALAAGALAACIEEGVGIPVEVCGGVKEGLSRALASDAEVVAVFGSLTLFHELAKGRGTKN